MSDVERTGVAGHMVLRVVPPYKCGVFVRRTSENPNSLVASTRSLHKRQGEIGYSAFFLVLSSSHLRFAAELNDVALGYIHVSTL